MTALAGVIGRRASHKVCHSILNAQAKYGSPQNSIETAELYSFGISGPGGRHEVAREGERWLAVADMRLDNRADLLRTLNLSARHPDIPDAGLLLKLWDRFEDRTLDLMVGDYAFAIFDRSSRADSGARPDGPSSAGLSGG